MLNNLRKIAKKIRNRLFRHEKINNPKLFMTILAKDEADVIEHQIVFHKSMGVDGFIVTDNNSSDGTTEIFEKYKKKGWIKEIISETSSNYEQVKWVDRMIKLASDKYSADWIINADADEFWCCDSGNLKDELANSFSNIIYANIYNVYPDNENDFYENDNLIVNHGNINTEIKKTLSPYSMYSEQIPKVIHRAKGYITIEPGNHSVKMRMPNKVISGNIHIYHYSLRSLEHFKRKMINGGASVNSTKTLPENAGQHWKYFYDIFINQGHDYLDEYENVIGSKYFEELSKSCVFNKGTKVKDFFSKDGLND
ncbi:glycosyltransferase family 2 protein [Vibrio coralliirubri]|uniref:glycosyltransferase family 2 protein n=1 Tax=Vibrio coralliirubri TaxID=1516159 RepID=UPI000AD0C043|nr:glycosyltransferase family 2 protein [Vibrio coralliirubri]